MIAPRGFVHQGQLEDPLHREAALRVRADLDSPIAEQRQHRRPATERPTARPTRRAIEITALFRQL